VESNPVAIRQMWRQEIWMWRQTFIQKLMSSDKYTVSFLNLDRNGDNEAFVATIVATETML
jgi:hypothetical protein